MATINDVEREERIIKDENKTMSLDGGIDMYSFDGKRFNGGTCQGRKVKFLDKNGHKTELERARELFKKDDILTIDEIEVGRNSSKVYFEKYPLMGFNTVMFADVESEEN